MGAAFHLPIQATEVALRNRISVAFTEVFGQSWWSATEFHNAASKDLKRDVEEAKNRIQKMNKTLDAGNMVASLSFGFWTGSMKPRFNPLVWSRQLTNAFPGADDGATRAQIDDWCEETRILRNRIWHHEPIIRANLSEHYSKTMKLLNAASPSKHDWVRRQCQVMKVLRMRP